MTRCKTALLLAASLTAAFAYLGVQASPASAFTGNPSSLWNQLANPQNIESTFGGGTLTTDEEITAADVLGGVGGLAALGSFTLASGGIVVIGAVWQSGLGSAFGSWLANLTNSYTTSRITGENWCPYIQPTWTGFEGTQTVTVSLPTCGSTASGRGTVAAGSQLPPYAQQGTHPAGFNSDQHNYWTLQFQGNCTDINNTGMFGLTGMDQFDMLVDPTKFSSGSGAQRQCETDAFTDYGAQYATPTTTGLVSVPNASCVIVSGTGGGCGSTGETCAQEALIEDSTSHGVGTTYTGNCYFVIATEKEMGSMLGGTTLNPCGNTGQPTCPTSNVIKLGNSTGTTYCGGQNPCPAALNKIDSETGGAYPDTFDQEPVVDCYLHGVTCPNTPASAPNIQLPRPLITETYPQYVARLRALGFLGSIFEVDDDMDYLSGSPALALLPQQITEVQISTQTPIPIYWPTPGHGLTGAPNPSNPSDQGYPDSSWPNPSINTGTDTLTILKVPDSYSPPGTPPGIGGGGPGSPGGCNCPPVDFTPLTGLSYGTAFPFGVFTWLETGLAGVSGDTTGTPPSFTLPFTGGTDTVSLSNSSWEATYRPIVFPIIEFLVTLVGVVFLSLKLFGHPGAD